MRLKKLPRKVFIDSNIFFYSIIMDKKYGKYCADIIRDVYNGCLRAYISSLILLEVANALRKFRVVDLPMKIKAVLSLPISLIEIDSKDILDAIDLAGKYNISPYDAAHIIAMRKMEINTIISADKDFDNVEYIKRLDPKEYKITTK